MKSIFRQDRIENTTDLILRIKEGDFPVFNYSATGISVLSKTAFGEVGDVFDGTLFSEEIAIVNLNLELIRVDSKNVDKISFQSIGKLIPISAISSYYHVKNLLSTYRMLQDEYGVIPESLRIAVFQLKNILYKFQVDLEEISNKLEAGYGIFHNEREEYLIKHAASSLENLFSNVYKQIEILYSQKNKDLLKLCLKFIQQELSILYEAPAANRFLNKPFGYAGDFEMMNMVYRNAYEGKNLFSKAVHHYCVNHQNAIAVRNRIDFLAEFMGKILKNNSHKTLNILSVASGPAEEVKRFIDLTDSEDLKKVKITLLDQDLISLKYAQMNILSSMYDNTKKLDINIINENIKFIIKNGLTEKYDFIYTAGLFDYFEDHLATLVAKKLYQSLNDNGILVIGNFDINYTNQAFMEALFDWHLIYRSSEQLKTLYGSICNPIEVLAEKEGTNLFAVLRK